MYGPDKINVSIDGFNSFHKIHEFYPNNAIFACTGRLISLYFLLCSGPNSNPLICNIAVVTEICFS